MTAGIGPIEKFVDLEAIAEKQKLNDPWGTLSKWEKQHLITSFLNVTIEDVREYYTMLYEEGESDNPLTGINDEQIFEALQYVSHKYDFGDIYEDIYKWAAEVAQERKDEV